MATEFQFLDVVANYTDLDNFSVLGVDTTYNEGNFFLTTITYQNRKVVDSEG